MGESACTAENAAVAFAQVVALGTAEDTAGSRQAVAEMAAAAEIACYY